jgi:trans-aconitate methyltransferase
VFIYVVLFLVLILFSIVYRSVRNGISPTPSSGRQIAAILQALQHDLSGTIYELGSGWGTLAIALARKFPDCRIVGIENSAVPYAVSQLLRLLFRQQNLSLRYGDMLQQPLVDATVVVCYLFPGGMQKLVPVLERLSRGTWIISNTFAIPGWKAADVLAAKDVYRSPIYVYRKEGDLPGP